MRSLFAFVVVLLALSGCPLVDVEVGVHDLCVTRDDIAIDGSPTAGDAAMTQGFDLDSLDALHQLADLDGLVTFHSATIATAGDGLALADVSRAHVTLASADPAVALPPLDAFDCDADCYTSATGIDLAAVTAANVLPYLAADKLSGTVELDGRLPTHAFSLAVSVCFAGTLSQSVDP